METQNHSRTIVAIAIFIVFLTLVYVYVFEPGQFDTHLPVGISDFRDRSFYKIDSGTILDAIQTGEIEVFTQGESSQPGEPADSALWRQADFIEVSRTLNQVIWNEPLSGWRLYSMHFSTPCRDDLTGFSEADFYYFKTVFRDNGKIRYTTQNFFISQAFEEVIWAGGSNFPRPLIGWNNIRLRQVQITAEDALAIAEANGGRDTRQLVDNNCRIHVRLAGDTPWQVHIYQNDTGSSLFRMVIDPDSGEIQ